MDTTSHFLGITLDSNIFNELFASLKKYLTDNHLQNIIELQNSSSLHITLYYFGKEISSSILTNIKADISSLNNDIFPIYINRVNFFQKKS